MIMGMPGAGKSRLAERWVSQGYVRLNRDERGGSLKQLASFLQRELETSPRVVVDNTYPSRASRAHVIAAARRHGVGVRGVLLETSLEDAQHNAAARVIARHGRLLDPDELRAAGEIGPHAQFRWREQLEPPTLDEGFAALESVPFVRDTPPGGAPALIVALDDVVWVGRPCSVDELELLPGVRDALARWRDAGYRLGATTWQPEEFDPEIDAALCARLGFEIVVARCRHPAGPPRCWCRKPIPGLALLLARTHSLDLTRSIHLGHRPADRGFAERAGMRYVDVLGGWPAPNGCAPTLG